MNTEMLTDKQYKKIAIKLVQKQCNSKLAHHILEDPNKLGSVITSIMTADWKWDGRGTIYGYRKYCASLCIYGLINEISGKTKNKKIKTYQFSDFGENGTTHLRCIDDHSNEFFESIDNVDYNNYILKQINLSTVLTDKEKKVVIAKILHNQSIKEIAEQHHVKSEAIRQTFKQAIKKIGQSLCVS